MITIRNLLIKLVKKFFIKLKGILGSKKKQIKQTETFHIQCLCSVVSPKLIQPTLPNHPTDEVPFSWNDNDTIQTLLICKSNIKTTRHMRSILSKINRLILQKSSSKLKKIGVNFIYLSFPESTLLCGVMYNYVTRIDYVYDSFWLMGWCDITVIQRKKKKKTERK